MPLGHQATHCITANFIFTFSTSSSQATSVYFSTLATLVPPKLPSSVKNLEIEIYFEEYSDEIDFTASLSKCYFFYLTRICVSMSKIKKLTFSQAVSEMYFA